MDRQEGLVTVALEPGIADRATERLDDSDPLAGPVERLDMVEQIALILSDPVHGGPASFAFEV